MALQAGELKVTRAREGGPRQRMQAFTSSSLRLRLDVKPLRSQQDPGLRDTGIQRGGISGGQSGPGKPYRQSPTRWTARADGTGSF